MPTGIYKKSKEHLDKIRIQLKKMNKDYMGKNNPFYGKKHTEKTKEINRQAHKGIVNKGMLGKHQSEKTRRRIGEAGKGAKNHWWKGGITPDNDRIRHSIEFHLWRESVFARDNFTCQKCQQRGGRLHSHHIFNFSTYLDLRFAIDNGITLCKKCHISFHKIYGRRNNTKEQLKEFLKIK